MLPSYSDYISLVKIRVVSIFLLAFIDMAGQEKKPVEPVTDTLPYFAKEEIIFDGKRYRIHNNYITAGGGYGSSGIRPEIQTNLAADYQFHIRVQHFQTGVIMSGNGFGDSKNLQMHAGYGYRREGNKTNLAAFIGPTYFSGVEGDSSTTPVFYDGFGGYFCLQGVYKFWYDVGLGAELFADVSYKQTMFGFKIIAYFSNAYRGPKRNINPNVRSENPR